MKLDIEVKNLGRFKGGTIKVRPLTVLTGENGTGKSFFTKTLYSIFSIVNKNLLYIETIDNIRMSSFEIDIFDKSLTRKGKEDESHIKLLKSTLDELHSVLMNMKDYPVNAYIQTCSIATNIQVKNFHKFIKYLKKLETKQKIKSVRHPVDLLNNNLDSLILSLTQGEGKYIELLDKTLKEELQENFQIANISELVSFEENETKLSTKGLELSFDTKNKIGFKLDFGFINDISNLSRVVFFESPAYWSVRDALNNSKEIQKENDLTGVPKYFYDLDKTLNTKSTSPPLEVISELVVKLKTEIGGEFIFESGRLSFVDNSGRSIDKNLISFGMTNLGMIQALLKNNVISEGSFVFFDEPETNLHPAWQVLLTKVLIQLAEKDVNVVMATHSLDMIKALEVHTKEKNGDFIAINHFTKEGGLFEFDSDDITENLIESRDELMNAYEDLFLSELYQGDE
ncbi:putative ATP-binding protein [uncultured Candidatus Thioglobus sp.]|nr:putative ATP-binding protein [uncultured Candidatus Thioglobus sp.]